MPRGEQQEIRLTQDQLVEADYVGLTKGQDLVLSSVRNY